MRRAPYCTSVDVLLVKLVDVTRAHQDKGGDKQVRLLPQHVERLLAEREEELERRSIPTLHYSMKERCEDEWRPLAENPELALEVSQKVAEIDVEEASILLHHDVVAMPVTNP